MEAIDIITNSEVSSVRSVTPTIETDSLKDVTTPPIYFGVETEPFFFLSSFFPSTLSLGHHEFLTAEAFFQAAKFSKHPNLMLAMKNTKSSKDMLYKIQHWTDCIPEDWEEKRLPIMKEIQELKFAQHKQLRDRLVQTGDAELIYRSKTDPSASGGAYSGDLKSYSSHGAEVEVYQSVLMPNPEGVVEGADDVGGRDVLILALSYLLDFFGTLTTVVHVRMREP
ncbi:hypothetical protein CF326_g8188 [Tilletia indica]|nr:hypothetical protein CF326_g8188 [Tilletia indica]